MEVGGAIVAEVIACVVWNTRGSRLLVEVGCTTTGGCVGGAEKVGIALVGGRGWGAAVGMTIVALFICRISLLAGRNACTFGPLPTDTRLATTAKSKIAHVTNRRFNLRTPFNP